MDFTTPLHPLSSTGSGARSKIQSPCNNHTSTKFEDDQSLPDNDNDENVTDEEEEDENEDSLEDNSNEIPVWVRGEQRWISGLSADTTCVQLVEALLRDDGLMDDDGSGPHHGPSNRTELLNQYVISEKWRRVEQILDANTKVLSIWTAWGTAQSEVGVLRLDWDWVLLLCFEKLVGLLVTHTLFTPIGGFGTLIEVRPPPHD